MAFKVYSIGMMFSFIVMAIGLATYNKTENIEALGLKLSLYGALMLGAIVWPIGLPTALALFGKAIIGKITGTIFNETEEAIQEVSD